MRLRHTFLLFGFLAAFSASTAMAQKFDDIFGAIAGLNAEDDVEPVTASGWFTAAEGDKPARLYIQADIQKGWHIFSITQPKGGPLATKLKLDESKLYKVVGLFKAEPAPVVHDDEVFGMKVEEHTVKVVWHAPIAIAGDADVKALQIKGSVYAQACEKVCLAPTNYKFVAALGTKKLAAAPVAPPQGSLGVYQHKRSNTTIRGHIEPAVVAPGGVVKLVLTADPKSPYHVYHRTDEPSSETGSKPTLIKLAGLPEGWTAGEPVADKQPVTGHDTPYYEGPVTWTIDLQVPADAAPGASRLSGGIAYMACIPNSTCDQPRSAMFEVNLQVAAQAAPGQTPLAFSDGKYGEVEALFAAKTTVPPGDPSPSQIVKETQASNLAQEEAPLHWLLYAAAAGLLGAAWFTRSDRPVMFAMLFASMVIAGGALSFHNGYQANTGELPWEPFDEASLLQLTGLDPEQIDLAQANETQSESTQSIGMILLFGFLGGLILNVMPCVLPVIGLKVMSFVQQAGESRSRVFVLNVWYSLGLISVFLVLAILAVAAGLGWGEQFQSETFTITMSAVVFVFALSLLGVWEIPIPGMVGSGKAGAAAEKEGAGGAFAKGVLTTILATPCTGPFLGTALAWAVLQPAYIVFATFTSMGLGMASPYLVLGAFPKLISAVLPKPGAWMDTFKQLMGFVLLGTVIWLLTSIEADAVIPAIALLFGLWLACWFVGKFVPLTADFHQKVRGWTTAAVLGGCSVLVSFGMLDEEMSQRLQWKTDQKVHEILASRLKNTGAPDSTSLASRTDRPPGRYTVLVDFTAHW